MRAIIKKGFTPGGSLAEIPEPTPTDDEVLIRVKAAAICGTDVACWNWTEEGKAFSKAYGMDSPHVFGHEFSGVVEKVGKKVENISIGSPVTVETHLFCGKCYQCLHGDAHNCQQLTLYGYGYPGCFSDYATAPASAVYILPESVSFEQAALLEPGCCAMFGIQEADVKPGDVVMVIGCGPIGQMAIQILQASGAGAVIALDIDDYKCSLARQLGAIAVNSLKQDPAELVRQVCGNRGGVDAILEISGSASVYKTIFDYLRPEGRISVLAHPAVPVPFDMQKLHHKGASVKGVFGRRIWDSWDALVQLISDKRVDLTKVITHRFPLEEAEAAFEQIRAGAGKVMLIP